MRYPGVKTFLKLIFFIISSWLLIHFFALFGVFLAVAYPIWWFFMPKLVPCLYCQTHKDEQWCPMCKKNIHKADGVSPVGFKSALANSLLILVISILSMGFVYLETKVLSEFGVVTTKKTASFVIPKTAEIKVGEGFPMEIKLAKLETAINAAQADIKFDPRIIEVTEISTKNSFATIFVQKEINNELGYVRFSGGLPNPGYSSDNAVLGTIFFKGKTPGVTDVKFLPSSMVLANDGKGTNVLKDLASASYIIIPSEPDEIFPDLSLIMEESGQIESDTKMDFSIDGRVLGTSSQLAEGENTSDNTNKYHPLLLLGTIDRIILDFWNIR